MLRTITQPSETIDEAYRAYTLVTNDRKLYTGRLLRNDDVVVLHTTEDKQIKVASTEVEELTPSTKSMMPDNLLQGLTAQQVSDVLAYLVSLRTSNGATEVSGT